jgi:hypothetical protein
MRKFWNSFNRLDSNRTIALAAVLISLCALFVSLQEVRIMRQQQRVNHFPYLDITLSYSGEGFSVVLRNNGTGLARVESMQIFEQDRYYGNWLEFIEAHLPDSLVFGYETLRTNAVNKEIIVPNTEVVIFGVPWNEATRRLEPLIREVQYRICYSSLLDERWVLENDEYYEIDGPCERLPEREFY